MDAMDDTGGADSVRAGAYSERASAGEAASTRACGTERSAGILPAAIPAGAETEPHTGRAIVLFDGECGFCSANVRFVLRRDRTGSILFAPLQGKTARGILERAGLIATGAPDAALPQSVVLRDEAGRVWVKSDAALRIGARLPWPWRWASALRVVPRAWRDAVYDAVARNRRKLRGEGLQCEVLPAEWRARILD